jgi:2,4-dienoyl-CoA reductase-like NADH-dependent reductase (Old Yellow Enzyme family)
VLYTTPVRLGYLELRNRMIMAPVKTAYGTPEGAVTDRHLRYYANMAGGGAAMIVLEPVSVTASGREHPKQLTVHRDHSVAGLRRIVDVIHERGSRACLHLNHAGRAANPKATGMPPVAPSSISCPTTGQTPRELSLAEIDEILDGYRTALARSREAGFDAVEIQCGHGYLVSQFLSPRTNLRRDAYGEDRALFLRRLFEIVAAERDGLAVLVRISAAPFDTVIVAAGMVPEDGLAEAIRSTGTDVRVIGDADRPADIFAATQDGYRAAVAISEGG